MKKTLICTVLPLALGFAANAMAASPMMALSPDTNTNAPAVPSPCDTDACTDIYAGIESMYAGAAQPVTMEINGWYAGRCYRETDHATPIPSVLIGMEVPVGGDNGPAFPVHEQAKVFDVVYEGGPANYFDTLTPEVESSASGVVQSSLTLTTPARIQDGALTSAIASSNTEYQIRKSGNYYVLKGIAIDTRAPFAYCYYFKKLK